jgi:hypothetical protein
MTAPVGTNRNRRAESETSATSTSFPDEIAAAKSSFIQPLAARYYVESTRTKMKELV